MAIASLEKTGGGLKNQIFMKAKINGDSIWQDQVLERISAMEDRLASLEKKLVLSKSSQPVSQRNEAETSMEEAELFSLGQLNMESRIGEFGMAWLGNIVLLFGFLFLTQYLHNLQLPLLSPVIGIVSAGCVYAVARFARKSLPYMSRLLNYNGHILLFFSCLRFHVLPGSSLIESSIIGYGLVLVLILAFVILSFRNNSQILAVMAMIMTVITAIISPGSHLTLTLLVGITTISIAGALRNNWWTGLFIAIVLVYFTFLIWLFGNPFISKTFTVIPTHQFGHAYLFACALGFSLLGLINKSETPKESTLNGIIVLNGLGFSLIFSLMVPAFFAANYYLHFGLIAAFCLGYSIFLQSQKKWKVIPAMYAIYSFVALSMTFIGIYAFPLAFFLLAIQSLLVVSMALWFRSRFIVIMNCLLFFILLITYLALGDRQPSINFSFAVVALINARILNWKKERLEIRTELIRNLFLLTGATMLLFSLQQAEPSQFVSLSWALTAMVFFILSVLIKNKKYRWLGIFTVVITVLYLFMIDLKSISLGYRIIALLFIAVISMSISIFYSRRAKQKE